MSNVTFRGVFFAGTVEGKPKDVATAMNAMLIQPSALHAAPGPQGGGKRKPLKGATFPAAENNPAADFYQQLTEAQREVIDALFAAAAQGLSDDELRARFNKGGSNRTLPGLLGGISKNCEAAHIPIEEVIDPNGRPKAYRLTPQFREAIKEAVAAGAEE